MNTTLCRRIGNIVAAVGITASLVTAVGNGADAAISTSFVSFKSFLKYTANATYPVYSARLASSRVANRQAFDEMRSFVLDLYKGEKVAHSFFDSGYYVDCVDIMTQPAVRRLGIKKIASAPASARPIGTAPRTARTAVSPLTMGRHDAYGNAISCPPTTIPMRRASLDLMTNFPTLHDYMAKKPIGGRTLAPNTAAGLDPVHPHAIGYQYVDNRGANSWLNLWNPSGAFTLSQQWVMGGPDPLYGLKQSAEGGWIHYPDRFGPNSVLFIYQTPDGYANGCWNLECPRPAFVQTSSNWALGAGFGNYSTYGGTQYGFGEQWFFQGGNWWLFLGTPGQAVGYYPGSSYYPGDLSRGAANFTEFGGETSTNDPANWPQMGSGKWPNRGFGQAAFHANVSYVSPGGYLVSSSLSPFTSNRDCYFIDYTQDNGGTWGTYFYFGGPGGANCGANKPGP
ncbi:MAG: hypothetical protein JWN52_4611 [Actinomycetia bacterium]|nr:hypothetical protein [Actinomycetes bacterium]